jgi:hypothetical protein
MPFLTKGKTNWKYILIVLILAAIVGGGILIFNWGPEIVKFIRFQKAKTPEEKCKIAGDVWIPSKNCCCPAQCLTTIYPSGKEPPECLCCHGLYEELEETTNWKTYRNDEYGFEIKYPEDWQLFQPGPKAFAGLNLIHLEIFTIETNSFYGRVFLHLFTDYEKPCEEFQIDDLKSLWFDENFNEVLVKRRNHQCFTFSYTIDKEDKETKEFKTSFIKNFQKSFSTLKFTKEDITENWKVYRDYNRGFEIKYPPHFFAVEVKEESFSGVAFLDSPSWKVAMGIPPNSLVIEMKEELGGKKAKDIQNLDELFKPANTEPIGKKVVLPFSSAFLVYVPTNKYLQYDYYAKNKDKIVKFSLISAGGVFYPFNQMLSTFRFLE